MKTRLLALDIDGTLVRRDGQIDPRDRDAIARARAAGMLVTLCTGRIYSGTAAVLADLAIDAEVVCADGSSVMCGRTGRAIEEHPLTPAEAGHLVEACDGPRIAPFLLSNHVIHHDARGRQFLHYVRGWSPSTREHEADLHGAARDPGEGLLMGVALGPQHDIEDIADSLRAAFAAKLQVMTFPSRRAQIGAHHALLYRRAERTKGSALLGLAARLGLRRDDLAAVGDWWNDLALFASVGRSFAMGQAPGGVKDAATDQLTATDETGGGVAEAIAKLLTSG